MSDEKNSLTPAQPTEIDYSVVDSTVEDLARQIVDESDINHTNDLVQLFNWNLSKKNALRLLKLNGLYDNITDQMIDRFKKRSGEFSNKDLLDYLQTIENSIDRTQKNLSQTEEAPVIQVNHNTTQVNFNVLDGFDSDSKSRIADAIKSVLNGAKAKEPDEPIMDVDFQESNEQEDNFTEITESEENQAETK